MGIDQSKNLSYLHEACTFMEQLLTSIKENTKHRKTSNMQATWQSLLHQESFLLQMKNSFHHSELQYFGLLVGISLELSTSVRSIFEQSFSIRVATWSCVLRMAQEVMPVSYFDTCIPTDDRYWQCFFHTNLKEDGYLQERVLLCHPWILTYAIYGGIMNCAYITLDADDSVRSLTDEIESSFLRYCEQGMKTVITKQEEQALRKLCNTVGYPVCHIHMSLLPLSWTHQTMMSFCVFFQMMEHCAFFIHCDDLQQMNSIVSRLSQLSSTFLISQAEDLPKELPVFHSPYTLDQEYQRHFIPFVKVLSWNEELPKLIAEPSFLARLEELMFLALHKEQVHTVVSPNQKQKGISMLFHGPSGSGKTLCAKWIAKRLQKPLWQIELSSVVDKYIGESEKHLESIFHEAQRDDVILLFDEADSLFTKRTAVSGSNDRYANVITSYLLQRMEQYTGIMILTSNFLHNFDDAFLRRMIAILRFQEASDEQRRNKWLSSIAHLQIEPNINWEELSKVKLTYARIDQCLLYAVSEMMRLQDDCMRERYIKKAITYELEKHGEQAPSTWRTIL